MTWFPTPDDVLAIHYQLVEIFADGADPIAPAGPRDPNLLASACTRPGTSLGIVDKYRSIERKAGALLHSLIKNHPFHNGNKRTALVAIITFLARNDRRISQDVTDDDVYLLITRIARNDFPYVGHGLTTDEVVEEIGAWFREHTVSRRPQARNMRASEFLAACERAGASCKESGGSFVVSLGRESIRFRVDVRELAGPVIKRYLTKLRLSEGAAGIALEEFEEGLSADQVEIRRFRHVLARLGSERRE